MRRASVDQKSIPHLALCGCGHTRAQHHPDQLRGRCRACAPCQVFTAPTDYQPDPACANRHQVHIAAANLLNAVAAVQRRQGTTRANPAYGWMQNTAGAQQFKPELEAFRSAWHATLLDVRSRPRKTARIGDLIEDASAFVLPQPTPEDVMTRTAGPKEIALQEQRAVEDSASTPATEVTEDLTTDITAAITEYRDTFTDLPPVANEPEPLELGAWYLRYNGDDDGLAHMTVRLSPPFYARAACGLAFRPGNVLVSIDPEPHLHQECQDALARVLAELPNDLDADKTMGMAIEQLAVELAEAPAPPRTPAKGKGKFREVHTGVYLPADHDEADPAPARKRVPKVEAEKVTAEDLAEAAPSKGKRGKVQVARAGKTVTIPDNAEAAPEPKATKKAKAKADAPATPKGPSVPSSERTSDSFAGKTYTATITEIEAAMKDQTPESVKGWSVTVGGREFPPKQVVAVVWGISRTVINTHASAALLRAAGLQPVNLAAK
jgi:hypothetical protein